MNLSPRQILQHPGAAGLALLVPGLMFLNGCVVAEPAHRTVYVEPAAPPSEVIEVVEAPPPPPEEIILVRPSAKHVWIRGYWVWREGRHVWLAGRWELPPRLGLVWVEPRWEHRERGYAFIAGSWRNGPVVVRENVPVQPAVRVNLNFVAVPPPPPRHEVVVERPSHEHVWIKGYWVWRGGQHVWIGGRWERPPHPQAVWVEPRWERHPEGHVFIEGYWR